MQKNISCDFKKEVAKSYQQIGINKDGRGKVDIKERRKKGKRNLLIFLSLFILFLIIIF